MCHHRLRLSPSSLILLLPQVDPAEQKRAQLLQQADVRCLDAAAKFAGLMGPLQLVEQGMGMVRGRGRGARAVQAAARAGAQAVL